MEIQIGFKRLPKWLRKAYLRAVNYTCEDCKKKFQEEELEVHRKKPGYKGGTYKPGNVKILCKKCHQKYAEEW